MKNDLIWESVQALDLSKIRKKYLSKKSFFWKLWNSVDKIEKSYREFLYLAGTGDQMVTPWTQDIDDFWHEHILSTTKYREDCHKLFGKFIEHNPNVPTRPSMRTPGEWRASSRVTSSSATATRDPAGHAGRRDRMIEPEGRKARRMVLLRGGHGGGFERGDFGFEGGEALGFALGGRRAGLRSRGGYHTGDERGFGGLGIDGRLTVCRRGQNHRSEPPDAAAGIDGLALGVEPCEDEGAGRGVHAGDSSTGMRRAIDRERGARRLLGDERGAEQEAENE